jgi:hypothetical protein
MRIRYLVAAVAIGLPLLQVPIAGASQGVRTFPATARHGNWGYEELSAAWWQWIASYPANVSPVADPTGEDCQLGNQPVVFGAKVPVFFLAGTTGGPTTRSCQIPNGVKVFIPAINIEDSLVEADSGGTIEGARKVVTDAADSAVDLHATLDGHPLGVVRAQALSAFPIDWAVGNPFGVTPGPTLAVADGYYVWLPPLSTGSHTLTVGGTFSLYNFTTAITYNLTVG